jgi:hypothetical protein
LGIRKKIFKYLRFIRTNREENRKDEQGLGLQDVCSSEDMQVTQDTGNSGTQGAYA